MSERPRARIRWALLPLSWIYRAVVRVRVWMYANGLLRQQRLNAAVVSVGNLTVGGTGKTPMVIWLAERFAAQGKKVGILSRGYKGVDGSSDEVEVMKARLGNRASFGVGADRYAEGKRLEASGVDMFLLDDGFQHLKLARDANILLMDASRPSGSDALLPAGCLREPVSEMRRADLLVFTRTETAAGTEEAIGKLKDFPVFSASTQLLGLRRLGSAGTQLVEREQFGSAPLFAFCGIGNPDAFFADLKNWNFPVCGARAFPDHHKYSAGDEREIMAAAKASGAAGLVTTEKDAQNFGGVEFAELPVYAAVIDFKISDEAGFWGVIQERLQTRAGA